MPDLEDIRFESYYAHTHGHREASCTTDTTRRQLPGITEGMVP